MMKCEPARLVFVAEQGALAGDPFPLSAPGCAPRTEGELFGHSELWIEVELKLLEWWNQPATQPIRQPGQLAEIFHRRVQGRFTFTQWGALAARVPWSFRYRIEGATVGNSRSVVDVRPGRPGPGPGGGWSSPRPGSGPAPVGSTLPRPVRLSRLIRLSQHRSDAVVNVESQFMLTGTCSMNQGVTRPSA